MRKACFWAVIALLAALMFTSACAEQIKLCGASIDVSAESIDLSGREQSYARLRKGFAQLPSLKTVALGKTSLSAKELVKLASEHPHIDIDYEIKLYGQWVSRDAEALDTGSTSIRDIDKLITNLSALPRLTRLTAYGTRMSKTEIEKLTASRPEIELHVTLNANGHAVRTDATSFSTLHTETDALHADFSILAYCKDLRAIDIGHNSVRDISFLAQLPQLRVLVLADNKISDISALASLEHLQYAELFMNNISDVTPLKGLKELLDLNLVDNDVSDITPILSCESLERAWLGRNPIPESAWSEAESALPGCLFNFTVKNCTGDDWRLHPRHKIKRLIFEGGSYVEWDAD